MAQYDLLLTQNVAAAGIEFSEAYVNIAKGGLLSSDAAGAPVVLAAGTNGYMLVADNTEVSGLKWQVVSGGHTQNTDIGTTESIFHIDSDGFDIEITAVSATKLGLFQADGITYADLQVKDLIAANIALITGTITTAPTTGNDIANKTYVDGILAANDAMVYKGVISAAANPNYPAANAGDTYKISVAGKIGGVSGSNVEVGDMLICTTDGTVAGDQATVGANWNIVQVNLDGVVLGPTSSIADNIALFDGTSGKLLKDSGQSLSSLLAASLFDANTILKADVDNTPLAMTVAEVTIIGRASGGNISALTPAEAMNVLWVTPPTLKTSVGVAGQIAKDANFMYLCTATNVWKRSAIATNW